MFYEQQKPGAIMKSTPILFNTRFPPTAARIIYPTNNQSKYYILLHLAGSIFLYPNALT